MTTFLPSNIPNSDQHSADGKKSYERILQINDRYPKTLLTKDCISIEEACLIGLLDQKVQNMKAPHLKLIREDLTVIMSWVINIHSYKNILKHKHTHTHTHTHTHLHTHIRYSLKHMMQCMDPSKSTGKQKEQLNNAVASSMLKFKSQLHKDYW